MAWLYNMITFGEGNGSPLQHSCLENPMVEEPGRLQSMGSWRFRHDWATSLSLCTFMHWRRKWQPTPVSCLENPRYSGAWWPAVYGVTQSWTWLKRLSSSSSMITFSITLLAFHFMPVTNPQIRSHPPALISHPSGFLGSFIISFIKTLFLLLFFFYFTILYWFCHTSTCIRHGCSFKIYINFKAAATKFMVNSWHQFHLLVFLYFLNYLSIL